MLTRSAVLEGAARGFDEHGYDAVRPEIRRLVAIVAPTEMPRHPDRARSGSRVPPDGTHASDPMKIPSGRFHPRTPVHGTAAAH